MTDPTTTTTTETALARALLALQGEVERLRENAEARERVMRREGDLLRAAQREVDELRGIYAALRQTSGDLCVVCGWRFFVPGMGCHGCERARLEAENERMRAHRELCTENLLKGYETGKSEERAAVVAWLRKEARVQGASPDERTILTWASNHIDRGGHRREEKE